ncbi:MAG: DUF975 family protein [Deltaproteobacteria bacterium]|nr:DUF975 family protein [Deltaproteobacteria bacterium]MBW2387978.1 DUF975 family protein [Deltaproteobacteria bacterium]
MNSADLSLSHLLTSAWETFKRRPGIAIAMWLVYVFFESGGSGGSEDQGVFQSLILLALILLSGPIHGGYDLAMLRLLREDDSVTFTDLFAGMEKFERLFLVFLVYAVAVMIGVILLVVPGVIIALGLWPAFLLVMEDDLGTVDALKGAWELTLGYKGQLFVLALTTAALCLLGILALGFGLLVAGPVTQLAWITAYDEIRAAQIDSVEAGARSLT